jgi:uncharacterized cupredoxin-like copper-binding protein
MVRRGWTIAIVASVLFLASACSSNATPQAAPTSPAPEPSASGSAASEGIGVTIQEWSITPTVTTAPAGAITFSVSNTGTTPHEFVVMSTDTLAADFPITSFEGEPDRFNEDKVGENVGETGDLEVSASKSITLDLQPGHYAFVCNLPGHYGLGMHVDFTVT